MDPDGIKSQDVVFSGMPVRRNGARPVRARQPQTRTIRVDTTTGPLDAFAYLFVVDGTATDPDPDSVDQFVTQRGGHTIISGFARGGVDPWEVTGPIVEAHYGDNPDAVVTVDGQEAPTPADLVSMTGGDTVNGGGNGGGNGENGETQPVGGFSRKFLAGAAVVSLGAGYLLTGE